ncbi:magnesium and cobalt transport protein CorA [Sphingomonas aracearum]|uniref:Magnesium and cobalt transport protein CorA n=1 Tax=Sphingomonas aracearum TaxID=2283317 RepID=A0A369VT47_9SPHN|nr:magnesium and cobalt transport protein CorA [Sphingomonas aracearum]RDE05203.1 magnesium and cobalt transport protein CorA [Sphingomonas aracearum]
MTVVSAFLYHEGRRVREVDIHEPRPTGDRDDFVWIGLFEPDEAELRILEERYDLHPLAIEDALKAHQLPKVDIYGNQLFVVARTAAMVDDHIDYGETAVFVGPNAIITVRHGSARSHHELRKQLEAAPELLKHGVDYVLHGILDFIVDGYQPIIDGIEEAVAEMEGHAMSEPLGPEETRRIFRLRRGVATFVRKVGPMGEVANKLVNLDMPCIDVDTRPYFKDVHDHHRRVEAMANGVREALTGVFEMSNLLEQQRQSEITRQLAAWAAILAVPTAIAGIYGMNFEHMPELHWRYGYPAVLAVIVVMCVGLYARFRQMRWL